MACFFALLGAFAPPLALILVWLLTPLVSRAFGTLIGVPLDDRSAIELMTSPRPQLATPRQRYTYHPGAEVPEAVAVDIRGRPYSIAAEVTIETPEAEGVLFSQGGRFGGHSLYIQDRKLCYTYSWLGESEQELASEIDVPVGRCILGVRFRPEGREDMSPTGMAALYINERQVAEGPIKTQPGKFGLAGGLRVGRSGSTPVSRR